MIRRWFVTCLVFLWAAAVGDSCVCARAASPETTAFGVAPHEEAGIEWWYVNAHITTEKGRHLAIVGSFFRFGGDKSPFAFAAPIPAHYLIYAVTDLDAKTQRAYSLADIPMKNMLEGMAPLLLVTSPHDKGAKALLEALQHDRLPPPHKILLGGTATVAASPFRLEYGSATPEAQNTLTSLNPQNTAFQVHLGGARKVMTSGAGRDEIDLSLTAQKPPMAVGGKGQTGLSKPTDYVLLFADAVRGGGHDRHGSGSGKSYRRAGLVRPPVGQLVGGAEQRLGLVGRSAG